MILHLWPKEHSAAVERSLRLCFGLQFIPTGLDMSCRRARQVIYFQGSRVSACSHRAKREIGRPRLEVMLGLKALREVGLLEVLR